MGKTLCWMTDLYGVKGNRGMYPLSDRHKREIGCAILGEI